MFKELRNKMLILNMSIISVLMLASFLVIYGIAYHNMQAENQNRLRVLSAAPMNMGFNLPPNILPSDLERDNFIVRSIPRDFASYFNMQVNSRGELQSVRSFIDMPEQVYLEAAELAWNGNKVRQVVNIDGRRWIYNITAVGGSGGLVISRDGGVNTIQLEGEQQYRITFLDVTQAQNTLAGLFMTLLMVGLGALVFIFAISFYFANRAIQPIAATWDKQKQFVANASHELKTPIAVIAANADALLANGEETVLSQRKWIDYIHGETSRMSKLVSSLLYLAKTDDLSTKESHAPFDFSALVKNAWLTMEAVAFEKNIALHEAIQPAVFLKSDGEKIGQIVTILLDNAIKYTEENGRIDLALKRDRRQVELTVANSGKGISPANLPQIFDRFFCGDPARTRENGGYGLGLAIAKAIADKLGAKIQAESVENKTTTFTVTFYE